MIYNYLTLLKTSYEFSKERKNIYILWLILSVIATWVYFFVPIYLWKLLNILQQPWENLLQDFLLYLFIYCLIPLIHLMITSFRNYLFSLVSYSVWTNYKKYLYDLITQLPYKWHTDNHSWETLNKFNKSSDALIEFSSNNFIYFSNYVHFLFGVTWILYFCFTVSIAYTIFVVALLSLFLVIFPISLRKFDTKIDSIIDTLNAKDNKVSSLLYDYIANIRTIITLQIESLSMKQVANRMEWKLEIGKQVLSLQESKVVILDIISNLIVFVVILSYGYLELKSNWMILVWNIVVLFGYLRFYTGSYTNIIHQTQYIVFNNADLSQSKWIIQDYEKHIRLQNQNPFVNEWNNIQINNLNFAYNYNEKKILDNIQIDIKKWEKIAFVGESWSWKSTMLSLLKWLYTTNDLELIVDGKKYIQSDLLTEVSALIPQDPEIFENTIRYNISFGLDIPDENILEAIKLAKFDKVLERLPNWLDTDIMEKWVNLSWWEKQRLALARWIFAIEYRSLILLDEPTSSVDSSNEIQIYKNIFEKFSDKAIISSIHRLHLLSMFHKIYVFDKGKILQCWTFQQLITQDWLLKSSWENYLLTNNESNKN